MSRRTEAVNIAQLVAVLAFAKVQTSIHTGHQGDTRAKTISMGKTSPSPGHNCSGDISGCAGLWAQLPLIRQGSVQDRTARHGGGYEWTRKVEQKTITLSLTQSGLPK